MGALDIKDVIAGVGLLGIVIAIMIIFGVSSTQPYGMAQAQEALPGRVAAAQALARTSDTGATLIVRPMNIGQTKVELHAGRPTPTSTVSPVVEGDIGTIDAVITMMSDAGNSNGAPFALFFPHSGGVSAALWTLGSPILVAEPTCVQPVRITINNVNTLQSMSLPCVGGLQPTVAPYAR